ncbi:EamA family transporter [Sulfitobacter aestuarii]|uniref:EamA family transporter n=1 Tax=Sulfitobacter aestuarii TaxID=2161676 RepID=A0ABW5TWU2_9RHOB
MSLILGLCAAICWALHDLSVRRISQHIAILPALLCVFVFGALFLLPVAVLAGDWGAMNIPAYRMSGVSGLLYGLAALSLYAAFEIGPVRLVSPIIGAFPLLSTLWAMYSGVEIGIGQWLAVIAIVLGVGLVALLSEPGAGQAGKSRAIAYSLLAALGFAATFATAQIAAQRGADLPVTLTSRIAATLLIALLVWGMRHRALPVRSALPVLALMGLLDALAIGLVTYSGNLPRPEFAAVAASLFGMLTVLLAWAILREPMRARQWAAAALVFCGIGYLGL